MVSDFPPQPVCGCDKSPYHPVSSACAPFGYGEVMPTPAPTLRIDMAGVARLAQVQRPVVSMWRARFAGAEDAFPTPVAEISGRPQFDAEQVAEWLARTGHGRNAQAREDAAADATPTGFSYADAGAVAELEAIIALSTHVEAVDSIGPDDLRALAAAVDPLDMQLRREAVAHAERGAPWVEFAARLVDAAYSPSAALARVSRAGNTHRGIDGSAGPLTADAVAITIELTRALTAGSDATVVLDSTDVELSSALAAALGDEMPLALPTEIDGRRVRRRLAVDGHWIIEAEENPTSRVRVARVPTRKDDSISTMLRTVDDVALSLRPADVGVVIGPARALIDRVGVEDERARADTLRTGHVRAVVRFPAGLVASAVRESLALWLLGTPHGDVAPADRLTAVADLKGSALSLATRDDLVSDLVSSVRSGRALHDRAFRFARLVRTTTLQARSDSLVAAGSRTPGVVQPTAADLPVLLDAAAEAVRDDFTPIPLEPSAQPTLRHATVAKLISARHLRIIGGTRLRADLRGSQGLVVVDADQLDTPHKIGSVRVDQLAFAEHHPSAELTRPGDVIFRTSPTAAAWVDHDGSKVVAYPARVLRVRASDPGGLVPEVIAADIAEAPGGPAAWKRWTLRRVDPRATAPLRAALNDIDAARADLHARAARLDHYAGLLISGVASGAVSMITTANAADAAHSE